MVDQNETYELHAVKYATMEERSHFPIHYDVEDMIRWCGPVPPKLEMR